MRDILSELDKAILQEIKEEEIKAEVEETSEYSRKNITVH